MFLLLSLVGPDETGPLPPGFLTPVMAFEFARTGREIEQLFLVPGSAEAMARVNRWDFLFMTFYSLLLGVYAVAARRHIRLHSLAVAALLAPLIWLADVLENVQLLGLTRALTLGDDLGALLARLQLFTWIKWGGLAMYFLLLRPYFRRRGGRLRVLSVLTVLPVLLAVTAWFARGLPNELMILAIGVMFVIITWDSWQQTSVARPSGVL